LAGGLFDDDDEEDSLVFPPEVVPEIASLPVGIVALPVDTGTAPGEFC
jgi:hypothetical protein